MKFIDTHCHLFQEYYNNDEIEEIIKTSKQRNIQNIIGVGTNISNSIELLDISNLSNGFLMPTIGIHPSEASENFESDLKDIDINMFAAIGEVGIDLYHENNPSIEIQKKVFMYFLELAVKYNKTIIIHMRNAENEVYEILKNYAGKINFIMHSFTSTIEWANKFIELGGYISFSGIVTFKNAKDLQKIATSIPLDRIVVETDAPYLTPTPHRGEKNFPYYVEHVAEFVANIREEENETVKRIILNNSKKLFNIE